MKKDVPLTSAEADFAAKNHNLVYKFLNDNNLPEDEFYDVVIFGFINAVKRYFAEPYLHEYSFGTIARKAMQRELFDHIRALKSQKRTADIISLHTMDDNVPHPDAADDLLREVEDQLLLHELAARASRQQMDILRLRGSGYPLHEIAGRHNITVKCVKQHLDTVRVMIMEICQE